MPSDNGLREDAYEAARGAVSYIVDNRNKSDIRGEEGFSDGYVKEKGFVTTGEGLTTIVVADEYGQNNDINLGSSNLEDEKYNEDFSYLIERIEKNDVGGDPYLDEDDTHEFTDSYSWVSTLLAYELIMPEKRSGIEEERIEDALGQVIDWFLENTVDADEHGAGWSWCGKETETDFFKPQVYFTWTSAVALAFLIDAAEESDLPPVDKRSDKIVNVLQEAKEFLVHECRTDNVCEYRDARDFYDEEEDFGWIQFRPGEKEPEGWKDMDPSGDIVSTMYVVWGASYISRTVDDISLTKTEDEYIQRGAAAIIEYLDEKADFVHREKANYECAEGKKYLDGTFPYSTLNMLIEYTKYSDYKSNKTIEYTKYSDYESDKISEVTDRLLRVILENCWAGDPSNPKEGFKHFIDPTDVDSDENVWAIYATEPAVEALLAYGVKEPDASTEVERVFNNLIQSVKDAQSQLENIDTPSEEVSVAQAERYSKGLPKEYKTYVEDLKAAFSQLYTDLNDGNYVGRATRDCLDNPDRRKAHHEFLADLLLNKCYFENDPDRFKEDIEEYLEKYEYMLPPFRGLLENILDLDHEKISHPMERKDRIENGVQDLIQRGYEGDELEEIGEEFEESISEQRK